ncbi:MAG: zinc ribbon domain-containing protein [Pseudonocardiaceae bacterium]|nr:MAG: zinc ribbon domain-containing protein [Pseudonocardiaceae bacterium]
MSHGGPAPRPTGRSNGSRPPSTATGVAALVASLLVLGSALTVYLLRDDLLYRQVSGVAQAAAPTAGDPGPGPRSTAPSGSLTAGDPAAALQRQITADRATAEGLVGRWVPQIGSKTPGLVVNGRTFDEASILADFTVSRSRFPQAILLRSDDYTSFRRGGFFVTLVGLPFATAQEANAWCDQQNLLRDDCFAKRLSHTEGPEGNSLAR